MQFENPISQNVANKLDSEIFSRESHGRSYPLAAMRAVVKTSLVDSGVNVRDAFYGKGAVSKVPMVRIWKR